MQANTYMELEKDSSKVSKKKMENGQFSTETEDNALIEEQDFKHTDTIHFIFWENQ